MQQSDAGDAAGPSRMHSKALRELISELERKVEISGLDTLTPKEVEALDCIARTQNIGEAAEQAGVSRHTFDKRLSEIRGKLGLENTQQLRAILEMLRTG